MSALKSDFVVFCDGASRGNPGPSASGFVVFQKKDSIVSSADNFQDFLDDLELVFDGGKYLGITTNNEAEWHGVISAIKAISNLKEYSPQLHVFLDSELVIKQINGLYKIKKPEFKKYFYELKDLEKRFTKIIYKHVLRKWNAAADKKANSILDSL